MLPQDYDKSIKAAGGAHSSNAKQLFAARRAPVMEEQWPQLQLVRINYLIAWGISFALGDTSNPLPE